MCTINKDLQNWGQQTVLAYRGWQQTFLSVDSWSGSRPISIDMLQQYLMHQITETLSQQGLAETIIYYLWKGEVVQWSGVPNDQTDHKPFQLACHRFEEPFPPRNLCHKVQPRKPAALALAGAAFGARWFCQWFFVFYSEVDFFKPSFNLFHRLGLVVFKLFCVIYSMFVFLFVIIFTFFCSLISKVRNRWQ